MVKTVLRYLYAGISFEEVRAELLRDEEFAAEYEKLRPRYETIEQIVNAGRTCRMHRNTKKQYFQTGKREL